MRRMTNMLMGASALVLLGGGAAWADVDDRHRGPDDRPVRRVRRADEARRRDGGEGHQRQGRRQRRAARARGRRRCLRPEAGGGGRQPVRQRGGQVRRRPFLLGLVDPGLGRSTTRRASCRSRPPRPTRRSPSRASTTSSAPAAATTSRASTPPTTSSTTRPATKVAILHDKTAYGKGLADEFKKELNARWASRR